LPNKASLQIKWKHFSNFGFFMLSQAGRSIYKKILPIDGNTVKNTFNSKVAIRVHSPAFSVNVVKCPPTLSNKHYRASVITGKKALGKSAVIRNRARRRIISAARQCFPTYAMPGKNHAFSFLYEQQYFQITTRTRGVLPLSFWLTRLDLRS
jgi:ribonuclease P protein component